MALSMEKPSMEKLKIELVKRAEMQISNTYGELTNNQKDLLGFFYDDAIIIIQDWLKLKTNDYFLRGSANQTIVRYIVRTYQEQGIEGQKASSVAGDTKSFKFSPADEIRNSLIQRV